jgi:hypothetical protein
MCTIKPTSPRDKSFNGMALNEEKCYHRIGQSLKQSLDLEGATSMKYRPAIIKAIEDLKDVLGSSSAKIQRYIQEVIYPENSEWFNSLFLRTLKNMKKSGDLVEQNLRFKLSPQLERKIAEAAELRSTSKNKSVSYGTKEDRRKRRKVMPAKKTTKAKAKIEPRQTRKRKLRKGEPMELRHEIPESFSSEEKSATGSHKPGEAQHEEKKKKGSLIVFSPKLKAEKAAMKIEKISV